MERAVSELGRLGFPYRLEVTSYNIQSNLDAENAKVNYIKWFPLDMPSAIYLLYSPERKEKTKGGRKTTELLLQKMNHLPKKRRRVSQSCTAPVIAQSDLRRTVVSGKSGPKVL